MVKSFKTHIQQLKVLKLIMNPRFVLLLINHESQGVAHSEIQSWEVAEYAFWIILSYLKYFGVETTSKIWSICQCFVVRKFQSPYSGHYHDPLNPSEIIFLVCMVFGRQLRTFLCDIVVIAFVLTKWQWFITEVLQGVNLETIRLNSSNDLINE